MLSPSKEESLGQSKGLLREKRNPKPTFFLSSLLCKSQNPPDFLSLMEAYGPQFDHPYYDDIHHRDLLIYKRGCGLWMPCLCRGLRLSSDGWHRIPTLTSPEPDGTRKHYSSWWISGCLKRIREFSEIFVAGPKWKTFVRRFNKKKSRIGGNGKYMRKFHYDPCSYSLNFDEGPGQNGDFEDDYLHRAFSSRYAAPLRMPSPR